VAIDIVGLALDFIAAYGLVAIFVLLVLDGALLLPVFPGEIVLIMAVAAYADGPGDLVFLILLTTAAGLVGSLLLYGITRGGGRRLVERFPRFFMMPRRRRERLERSFQRPLGQSLVLFLRLVPFTRILVNIPAGLARMPIVRFLVLSTIGLGAYHAAFLWFTFEANRPGSAIAGQKEQLQQAYLSPAWEFVQAHTIVSGAVLLLIGIVLSARASARMFHDPHESTGSLVGSLAMMVLFWGGIVLAVATYMEPASVYGLAELGGVDLAAVEDALGVPRLYFVFAVAAVAALFGLILGRMRRTAMLRRWQEKERRRIAAMRPSGLRPRGGEAGPGRADRPALLADEQVLEGRACAVCTGRFLDGDSEWWALDVAAPASLRSQRASYHLHPACAQRIRDASLADGPLQGRTAEELLHDTADERGIPAEVLDVWFDHVAQRYHVVPTPPRHAPTGSSATDAG